MGWKIILKTVDIISVNPNGNYYNPPKQCKHPGFSKVMVLQTFSYMDILDWAKKPKSFISEERSDHDHEMQNLQDSHNLVTIPLCPKCIEPDLLIKHSHHDSV